MPRHALPKSKGSKLKAAATVAVPVLALVAALGVAIARNGDGAATSGPEQATMAQEVAEEPLPEVSPDPPGTAGERERRRQRLETEIAQIATKQQDVRRKRLAAAAERASLPSTFRVASFNVLGASHTNRGGNKKGWASGYTRMSWTVGILDGLGVDVVGFQEFEGEQFNAFNRLSGGRYGVFPGLSMGVKSVRFSIAWRLDEWTVVSTDTIGVPYAGGNYIQMPVIRLMRNDTGREVYFANFHNPADTKSLGRNGKWRAIARGIQINLVNRLRAETGLPVVITGDMNDRAGYFCPMVAGTDMGAANGGSLRGQPCAPPPAMQVDWIFGSTPEITWTGYTQSRAGLVSRASDHGIVYADATVAGTADPTGRKSKS